MFQEILKTEVAKTCFFHSELRNAASAQKFLLFESVQSDYKANKEYITNPTGQLIIAPKWNIIAKMYDNQACPRFRKFWKTLFYPSLEILRNSNQNFFPEARGQWGCSAVLGLITKNQTIVITALHFIQILNSQINVKFNHKLTSYNNDFYYLKHKLNLAWNYTNTVGKFLHYTLTFNKNFLNVRSSTVYTEVG